MMESQELDTVIEASGLSDARLLILPTALPAVYLHLAASASANPEVMGQSRIGGVPDLPDSAAWPRGRDATLLSFILQINLAEVPKFAENPLPPQGMLYLFAGDVEPDAEQVLLYTGQCPLSPALLPEEARFATDYYEDLIPQLLRFELRPDIPRWASDDNEALCDTINEQRRDQGDPAEVEEAIEDIGHVLSGGSVGKMFGHTGGIGRDVREDAFLTREGHVDAVYHYERRKHIDMTGVRNWVNLLWVDSVSEANLMFGDAGYLEVLVHREALQRLDLTRAYVSFESS